MHRKLAYMEKIFKHEKSVTIICLVSALLLVLGCFKLPIGYYTFLRILVFFAAIIVLVGNICEKNVFIIIITALVGILFNPIFPVYLHNKSTWIVLDLLSAGWFVYCAVKNSSK